jgi:uncharacterized protein YndB with AHSA1/START domain
MPQADPNTDVKRATARTDRTARSFEMEIDIDAPAAEVWRALTEAEELVRWFPIGATVTPGPGGAMTWTWEGAWTWRLDIQDWQPGERLLLGDSSARPFDAEGRPVAPEHAAPAQVAIELTLASHQGSTRLRIVHSGFGTGSSWDDELDGVSSGWQFEVRSLRHYLERHRGRRRYHGWAHVTTPWSEDKVWRFLLDDPALVIEAPAPQPLRPYVAHLRTVGRFSGVVLVDLATRAFAGTASELDDGIFRVETFRAGGRTGVIFWFATWTPEHALRAAVAGEQAAALLKRLLPA